MTDLPEGLDDRPGDRVFVRIAQAVGQLAMASADLHPQHIGKSHFDMRPERHQQLGRRVQAFALQRGVARPNLEGREPRFSLALGHVGAQPGLSRRIRESDEE